jgi:hypothetical protein
MVHGQNAEKALMINQVPRPRQYLSSAKNNSYKIYNEFG